MKNKIGEKIKILRKKANITQEKLADYLGITFQSISRWESGICYPDLELLPEIANYFKITTDELLGVGSINKQEKETISLIKGETAMENNKSSTEKVNVIYDGPYRFIGKAIYARAGESDGICIFAMNQHWVFKELDNLKEYATEDIHNAALITWDKYDDKNKLMGYIIGRFFQANTPVPENLDYYDIPEGYIARCFCDIELDPIKTLKDEINQQGEYNAATWIWSAEIYADQIPTPNIKAPVIIGFYSACEKK